MKDIINLQNTPDSSSIRREQVQFASGPHQLSGLLFRPFQDEGLHPTVVVGGAWTTVKEQMAGTYARAMAERGFVSLAFDYTGWGQSEGQDRYREDPAAKTLDVLAAIDFLLGQPGVDQDRVSVLGICASAGYMAAAAADHGRVSRLALVAPWLHDQGMAESVYGGAEAAAKLVALSRQAKSVPAVAASTEDEAAVMYKAPYYTESHRGLIQAYDNRFSLASWEPWLSYDAQASAHRLSVPTLIVCSEAAALPEGARRFAQRTKAPISEKWFNDVSQFDFYDRSDIVAASVEAVSEHLA